MSRKTEKAQGTARGATRVEVTDEVRRLKAACACIWVWALPELDSGWVARVGGLSGEYGYTRLFLGETSVHAGRHDVPRDWVLKCYDDLAPGVYQVDAPKLPGGQRVWCVVEACGAIELGQEAEIQALLRARSQSTLQQVEALCLHRRWDDALSAALNIAKDTERQDALVLLTRAREARDGNGWVEFDGSDRQVRWAKAIRLAAAARLVEVRRDWMERFEEARACGMTQEVLDAMTEIAKAGGRIRHEAKVSYWIAMRHELESPDAARLLWALVHGEGP